MNKLWIYHSHDSAERCLEDFLGNHDTDIYRYEYLDIMGLFETSWMIYEYHNDQSRNDYGYPK